MTKAVSPESSAACCDRFMCIAAMCFEVSRGSCLSPNFCDFFGAHDKVRSRRHCFSLGKRVPLRSLVLRNPIWFPAQSFGIRNRQFELKFRGFMNPDQQLRLTPLILKINTRPLRLARAVNAPHCGQLVAADELDIQMRPRTRIPRHQETPPSLPGPLFELIFGTGRMKWCLSLPLFVSLCLPPSLCLLLSLSVSHQTSACCHADRLAYDQKPAY